MVTRPQLNGGCVEFRFEQRVAGLQKIRDVIGGEVDFDF
jgi:hypothetical protein